MKKTALIFVLVSASMTVGFCQQNVNPNGYNKFYYENGTVSSEGTMENGHPNGYWKTYYDNNVLKSEGNRKSFELDSVWTFYNKVGSRSLVINYKEGMTDGHKLKYNDEDVVLSDEIYKNDVRHGVSSYFYKNGNIKEEISYSKGNKQGKSYEYDRDSVIITIQKYESDFLVDQEYINRRDRKGLKIGRWKMFYASKRVRLEGKYINGKREGFFREFSDDGKLLNTFKYVNGELMEDVKEFTNITIDKEYYIGAKVKSEMTLVNGIPNGIYRKYTKEGEVIEAKLYRNGFVTGKGIIDKQGKRQNEWVDYYVRPMHVDSGYSKKASGNYKDGVKIGKWVYYHENSTVEQEGQYLQGKPHGIWKWYFDNGQLLRKEEFTKGVENGFITEYSDSGEVIIYGEYVYGVKEGKWIYDIGDSREEGNYKDGNKDGLWKHYYKNNVVSFEGEFFNGDPNGKHKFYYSNGKIRKECEYTMGKKDGTWKKYDKEGKLLLVTTYENGIERKIDGVKIKPAFEEE